MHDDVTAVIPTIPPRAMTILPHAMRSVMTQTHPVAGVSIAIDGDKIGAWHTRRRALAGVTTPWTAFLDDDDSWYPFHVEHLLRHAYDTQADYVFSWFDLGINCSNVDRLGHFGKEFDPKNPHHTTITILVKTELAQAVNFSPPPREARVSGEDWTFTLGCIAAGAKIVHLPERTWVYNCFPGGTHGLPTNW